MSAQTNIEKKKPTGDGNPTAGAINVLDFSTGQRSVKSVETLRSELALLGLVLRAMSDSDDVEYMDFRWASVHRFGTLAEARDYLLTLQAEVAV